MRQLLLGILWLMIMAPAIQAHQMHADYSFRQDENIIKLSESFERIEQARRAAELELLNEDLFSRLSGVLNAVPVRLLDATGKTDDFFTPNYLRADYKAPCGTRRCSTVASAKRAS